MTRIKRICADFTDKIRENPRHQRNPRSTYLNTSFMIFTIPKAY
jgi:hypothetical protein